jgi:hypothetical protein
MGPLSILEYCVLRAIQRGELRRRASAPPAESEPTLASLLERGLLVQRGEKLLLTEDGVGALEVHELPAKRGGTGK